MFHYNCVTWFSVASHQICRNPFEMASSCKQQQHPGWQRESWTLSRLIHFYHGGELCLHNLHTSCPPSISHPGDIGNLQGQLKNVNTIGYSKWHTVPEISESRPMAPQIVRNQILLNAESVSTLTFMIPIPGYGELPQDQLQSILNELD